MRRLALLLAGASIALAGCSSGGGQPDEAKLHKELGAGPPSLEGMAKKHPGGARQEEKMKAAGINPGAASAAGGPPAGGN